MGATPAGSSGTRTEEGKTPRERRPILIASIAIMAAVSLSTAGAAIYVLYTAAFEQHRGRLEEVVKSRARLIEAVARFDRQFVSAHHPGGAAAATLAQIVEAHEHFGGFGETGEFTLARRDGDNIVWLLRHRHAAVEMPVATSIKGRLAEPMVRALQGESGTIVGLDYRGARVLAAYEPVQELDCGVVAKIDLEEIRKPFARAGGLAGGIALALVALGAWGIVHTTSPLVQRLEDHTEELRITRNRLRAAAAEATLAEERERRNLATDLHDGLGQLLAFANMRLGMLRSAVECYGLDSRVREIEQLISDVHQRAGSLTFQLSPPVLHDVGFSRAAQWLAEDLEQRLGIHITLEDERQDYPLDEEIRITLYRSLRELLINVAKHAGADAARVRVWSTGRFVGIAVEDEGRGFDTEADSTGYGLFSIRERLNHLGGSMQISSAAGKGTRVVLLAPIARSDRGGEEKSA